MPIREEGPVLRRNVVWLLVLALLIALFPASLGFSQTTEVTPLVPAPVYGDTGMVDETSGLWFIELAGSPVADGGKLAALQKEKANLRSAAASAKVQLVERFAFDTLWNGISVEASADQLGQIARLPGVKAIYPVEIIPIPETEESSPDLYSALAMTGADVAQSELGYTGSRIKVAVMDTGIDYMHPDLGGGFGSGYRVIMGHDFVGDAFNADPTHPGYDPEPHPDDDPMDTNGHGTHVAGIIGANGAVVGVAPQVSFGAYRVFGTEGSTTAEIMIQAMERALQDKMQVLNMSIGSAYQWPQYPTAQAADRLVNKGMVVVASIGNNGANGLYAAGAPGIGQKVIGVASFDNTHAYVPCFEVSGMKIGYIPMTYSAPIPTSGTYEVVYIGVVDAPLPEGSLAGKVALAERGGGISFGVKASRAIAAGAVGVLIHNNVPGLFSGTLGAPIDAMTPVVGISLADGVAIRALASPVDMTWTDQMLLAPNANAGLISSFSSYGLPPDLSLKPDLGAPGGNIYSTYPRAKGSYTTMSGTSMASPHVAGAVALLLEAKPKTNAQSVRTVLQNSADPKVWWGSPGSGFLDNVHRQGAGMLDIDDAILATTKIDPGKLAIGESEAGAATKTLTVENSRPTAVTYDLSYVNALSTGGVIAPLFYTSNAVVAFSSPTVTVPARGKATVTATISPASGPITALYGGYIVFTPQGGGQVYRVPFAGYVGDYQGIEVLAPNTDPFPCATYVDEGQYWTFDGPEDHTFTMADGDIPYLLVHFDHQCELFRVEVVDANSGRSWHKAFEERYVPRNSTPTGFFAFAWDGYTTAGKKVSEVPNGDYVMRVSLLKALGDPNNPAHWETWTSPVIRIERP